MIVRQYILAFLLCLFSAMASAAGKFVLVIDAGHGGRDAGCPGAYSYEKNLTLKYSLAFGRIVERNCPDVKVLYTRTTDRFIELKNRAQFANDNKANLFVSVHINAVEGSKIVRGYQTYTLGRGETTGKAGIKENLEVAKRENSVIYMEKDYKQNYQDFDPSSPESNIMFEFIQDANMERSVALAKLLQSSICAATGRADKGAHQNNLAVLRLTSMPACLMELGYLSTPDEEAFLNAESSVDKYARGFLKAFISYKNKYFDGLSVPYRPSDIRETEVPQVVPDEYKEQPARAEKKRGSKEIVKQQPESQPQETAPSEKTEKPNQSDPSDRTSAPSNPSSLESSSTPVFKVQICVVRTKLKTTDKTFKGLPDVDCYEEGGFYKYTVGASTDYNAVSRRRKELLSQFPEAFIVAFKNGQKMNVNEAITEFKKRKIK